MNRKEIISLLIIDETERIAGAVCVSMTKTDILFDIFEYIEDCGCIVDVTIPGMHFRINERLENCEFIEKIDGMLSQLRSLMRSGLHVDEKSFHNVKEYIDFKKLYTDNFKN